MNNRITALKQELKQLQEIQKTNEKFKKLTLKEKRIAVCQDVLAQLKAEKYKATQGTYVHINALDEDKMIEDLSELVCDKNAPECTVCAKGALFLSQVRKGDNFSVDNIRGFDGLSWDIDIYAEDFDDYQEEIFTRYQLDLIEYVFERKNQVVATNFKDSDLVKIDRFLSLHAYATSEEMLVAILTNMIKNNGTFKP